MQQHHLNFLKNYEMQKVMKVKLFVSKQKSSEHPNLILNGSFFLSLFNHFHQTLSFQLGTKVPKNYLKVSNTASLAKVINAFWLLIISHPMMWMSIVSKHEIKVDQECAVVMLMFDVS
jgi:hypothetical protein